MLPQINAQLISIEADSTSDDWDSSAGVGSLKWQGNVGVYALDKIRTVFAPNEGALVKFKDVNILIDSSLSTADGDPLEIQTGDILTYTQGVKSYTRRVMDYSDHFLPEIPASMRYSRLHLEPQRVEA
jgi:hypothetical protein